MIRHYSIRSLLVFTLLAALICSYFSWRHHRLARHRDAMQSLESLGADVEVIFTLVELLESQQLVLAKRRLLATPTTYVTAVSLADPNIDSGDVGRMIPHLGNLIPSPDQRNADRPFLRLSILNQTCMTDELRTRIKTELPHCMLSDYSGKMVFVIE